MTYPNHPQGPQPWMAPKPGVVPLQPPTPGQILGGSIATLWRNWQPMILIPFLLSAVFGTVEAVTGATDLPVAPVPTAGQVDPGQLVGYFQGLAGADAVVAGFGILTSVVTYSVGTVVTARAVLGRRTSIGQALRALGSLGAPLLGMLLLVALIGAACVAVPVLLGFALGTVSAGLGLLVGLLGGLVGIVFAVHYSVSFSFGAPALVLEPQPVVGALRRSRWLVRGDWWRVFGTVLLSGLLVAALSLAVSLPLTVVRPASTPANVLLTDPQALAHPTTAVQIASVLVYAVVAGLGTPFVVGVTVLLYHDYRIREESFHQTLYAMSQEPDTL
jgi:hypothetical protein